MSILLYNYKELTKCISEVERIEAKVEGLDINKETEEDEFALLVNITIALK
jgi:hypothetical protein